MDPRNQQQRYRLWFECAQILIALFVPLAIVAYTITQNNTEISIAQENRLQDLKIASERHEQEMVLSDDQQEEATLVHYFDSLGRLLEKNEKLTNETNIVRFKTLTALAQLKSKRKAFLIRSLIENNLIIMNNGESSILDLSLADLNNLDLTQNMLVNNQMTCVILSQTTLINSTFQNLTLNGVTLTQSLLSNSDFSYTIGSIRSCGDGNLFGINFKDSILDDSIFNYGKYTRTTFSGCSLNNVEMRHVKCVDCRFSNAQMNLTDLSESQFLGESNLFPTFQSLKMVSTNLSKTIFSKIDFSLSIFTMINANQTTFNNSYFSVVSLKDNTFIQTMINNCSFFHSSFVRSQWFQSKIISSDFYHADLTSIQFIDSQCYSCVFNGTNFTDANLTNSIFDGSDFRRSNIQWEQLSRAKSIENIILPNGTIFQSKH